MKLDLDLLPKNTKKIAVAISGGCDSMALAFLLNEFCQKNNIDLIAITVDHKVRKESTYEALALEKILKAHNIDHHILSVSRDHDFTRNIEANMRKARYDLLYDFCQKNNVKHLFLGHHLGDVAENFLIRLFRGSGLDGLSTMSEMSDFKDIKLVRPLLEVKKEDLKQYLTQQNISWFEDESNQDEKFLRNKIRNFLNSFEEKDLINQRVKNTSDDISQIRDFFDDKMLNHAREVLNFENKSQPKFIINTEKLNFLDEKYALKILSLTFMEISQRDYKPRLKELKKFYIDLKNNVIRDFYGCSVSKNKQVEITKKDLPEHFNFRTILKNIFE